MFKSLKKAFAILASVAILATTNAGVVFAQTFNDVATDAWYYDFVETLVADGVVDVKDNFYPGRVLNRAELVKMVVTAVDGLAGYTAPATPTFDDVATDAWYYDFVEAAVQLNVIEGYKDAQGNLTGFFGPSDVVNRAAATKILVEAFGVASDLDPASKFSDVSKGSWFYEYVVTAYNQSILDGYDNGNFGPADPVTRAQVAKLIVNAQDPVERGGSEEKKEETKEEEKKEEEKKEETKNTNSDGALEVSVNDKTASSSTLPKGSTGVELLSLDFTAADDDVAVSNVVVTRGGVGQTADWEQIFFYDGQTRLTTGRSVNSDTNTATFALNFTVEAGKTETLRVVGDVASTASANNQHFFYVASSADVTSNAKSVAGDFPVAGNTFTVGSVDVTTVRIQTGSTPSQPKVGGANQEISALRLSAGADNDVALHKLTLTQNGSLSSAKMKNLKLLRGTDEVATAAGFDGDTVTFVLDTPYVIDKGQTKNFYVRADIDGGRPSDDTIELYLDEDTDLYAVDQQYGFGASVTNSFATSNTPTLTLEGSDVTIVDNGPAARDVAQNSDNVALFDFSITADRDIDVKEMDLVLKAGVGGNFTDVPASTATTTINGVGNLQTGFDTTADLALSNIATGQVFQVDVASNSTTYYCMITGDATANEDTTADTNTTTDCPSITLANGDAVTYNVDPYQWIENVKIVDIDSNATLQGPVTRWNATTKSGVTNTTYSKTMTEDYTLTGGETRHLRVVVDFNQNMPSGLEVEAEITFGASDFKDVTANKFVDTDNIVGGTQTSKRATVKQNSLSVAQTSNVISQEYVKGSKDVACGQYSFTAGDAGDITIKKIFVYLYGDDDGSFDGTGLGDIEAKSFVSSVSLYDGDTLVSGPESLELVDNGATGFTAGTDYNRSLFDNLKLVVKKGETKTLTARVDLLSNFSTGSRYLACDMEPGTITAEDDDANTITATSATTNLNKATSPNPVATIIQGGTLTATSTSGNIASTILVGGTDDVLVAQYSFNAEREAYNVNKLTIINDLAGTFGTPVDTNAVTNVKIVYPDVNGQEKSVEGALTNGSRTFSGLSFHVPRDKSAVLKVYADATSISNGLFTVSGDEVRLGLREGTGNSSSTFVAVGVSSSATDNFDAATDVKNSTNISKHVVRKAKPVFAKGTQSSTAMPTTGGDLYKFTVTANGGDVSFGRFVFDVNTTGLNSSGADVYDWEFRNGAGVVQNHHIWGVGTASSGNAAVYLKDSSLNSGLQEAVAGTTATSDRVQDGLYKVVVSFDAEQIVSAGKTETFTLRASINGASTDDTVNVSLAKGDEAVAVSGITANHDNDNGFGNTSSLVGDGGTEAVDTITIGAVPAAAETVEIGACVVTFTSGTTEQDCADGAASIDRDSLNTTTIAELLDDLTSVSGGGHGFLVPGTAAANVVVFTATGTLTGSPTFVDGTGGDVTVANTTAGVSAVANTGIFVNSGQYFGEYAEVVPARNVVWSDRVGSDFAVDTTPGSAQQGNHTYATVAGSTTLGAGTVTAYTGTLDWTNGYLLEVDELSAFSFKK